MLATGEIGRGPHPTPPEQSKLARQSGKQNAYPEPVSGERQMFPGGQSSCWDTLPPSEIVHAPLDTCVPLLAQTGAPVPSTVHFSLHQSQLPVWQTGSQGAPLALWGVQASTLGMGQTLASTGSFPPVLRLPSSPGLGENEARVHATERHKSPKR
jgi:hypothetical protein